MSIPAVNVFGPSDWYRTIRDQIQHEDNLLVQRLAWLMAAQSFFFTGYCNRRQRHIAASQSSFGQTARSSFQYHSSSSLHF
jgi:hypothetical protein